MYLKTYIGNYTQKKKNQNAFGFRQSIHSNKV